MGGALIADSFEAASRIAPTVPYPVATLEGDVFRGKHVVTGGDKTESRGILATKREIKELREKITDARAALERLIGETAGFEQAMAHATAAIAGLTDEIPSPGKVDRRRAGPGRARRRRRSARRSSASTWSAPRSAASGKRSPASMPGRPKRASRSRG